MQYNRAFRFLSIQFTLPKPELCEPSKGWPLVQVSALNKVCLSTQALNVQLEPHFCSDLQAALVADPNEPEANALVQQRLLSQVKVRELRC
jgi:hypothetical protein